MHTYVYLSNDTFLERDPYKSIYFLSLPGLLFSLIVIVFFTYPVHLLKTAYITPTSWTAQRIFDSHLISRRAQNQAHI